MNNLLFHPYADIFPLLDDAELQELADDIQENGLQLPIILLDGKILDGRNRYRACRAAGIEPAFETYSGDTPLSKVISLNLNRRHLSESQRAMVAARIVTTKQGERTDLSPIGERSEVDQAKAAEMLKVGKRSVERAARVQNSGVKELQDAVEHGDIAVSKAAEIAKLEPEKQRKSVSQLVTSSESNEWYTPAQYIDSARLVMDGIDLDPASCEAANTTVKADKFFTKEDDGLTKIWVGKVWMNPPYGGHAGKFIEKLLTHYHSGEVSEAVVLINSNSQDVQWFKPLWDHSLCFCTGRIKFCKEDGTAGQANTAGSVFIYLGDNSEAFAREFQKYGQIIRQRWRIRFICVGRTALKNETEPTLVTPAPAAPELVQDAPAANVSAAEGDVVATELRSGDGAQSSHTVPSILPESVPSTYKTKSGETRINLVEGSSFHADFECQQCGNRPQVIQFTNCGKKTTKVACACTMKVSVLLTAPTISRRNLLKWADDGPRRS